MVAHTYKKKVENNICDSSLSSVSKILQKQNVFYVINTKINENETMEGACIAMTHQHAFHSTSQ